MRNQPAHAIDNSKLSLLGFCELIPNHLLRPFDERELELVICGISNIDVADWKQHTRLKHCNPETPQVVWFWKVINWLNRNSLQVSTGNHFRWSNHIHRRCGLGCCNLWRDRRASRFKVSRRFKATRVRPLRDSSPSTWPATFRYRICQRLTRALIESIFRHTTATSCCATSWARQWRRRAASQWNKILKSVDLNYTHDFLLYTKLYFNYL